MLLQRTVTQKSVHFLPRLVLAEQPSVATSTIQPPTNASSSSMVVVRVTITTLRQLKSVKQSAEVRVHSVYYYYVVIYPSMTVQLFVYRYWGQSLS